MMQNILVTIFCPVSDVVFRYFSKWFAFSKIQLNELITKHILLIEIVPLKFKVMKAKHLDVLTRVSYSIYFDRISYTAPWLRILPVNFQ